MTTAAPVEPVEMTMLIDSLWQARNAEHELGGSLATARPLAAEGVYGRLLDEEGEQTQQRLHDLDARLAALGERPSPVAASMTTMRHVADDALEMSKTAVSGGMRLLRREPTEPALVDAVRAQTASAAFARATYQVLRATANASSDPASGELAARCHAEIDVVLRRLDEVLPTVVAQAYEAAGSRPSYRDAATMATARVRGAMQHLGQDVDADRHQLRDALTNSWQRARRMARLRGEPRRAPIPDYDQLTASKIIERLPHLSPAELETVEKYEQAHAKRVTILTKIRSLRE